MTTPALSIAGLCKSYAGVPALRGARLELFSGEVHALMGENGAGKSTLIKILAGAVPADAGEITVDGQVTALQTPSQSHHAGFRFIHQELSVIPHLSVAENLFLGRPYPRRFGLLAHWPELNRRARAALSALSIDHIDPSLKMARLATGDQMLVKIAAAFLDDDGAPARIYVMDEPTAALTDSESERLFAIIARLKARGCAVLYVSHRMDEVMRIADRVTVMRDGETVSTAAIADVTKADIIEWMTGRTLAEAFPQRLASPLPETLLDIHGLSGAGIDTVDLSVRRGEILGIAGLSGAGQNELLKLLIGAEPITGGEIRLDGRKLGRGDPARRWQEGFAYVPRERRREGLVAGASIGQNTILPHLKALARAGIFRKRKLEQSRAAELGKRVRLKAAGIDQPVRQLSGGNQQKVVFARAMLASPKMLLLDEPSRGVDVGAKFDIHTLLRELSAAGAGILLASTDLPELIGMTDRIAIMRAGRIAEIVETAGLDQAQLLALIFGDGNLDAQPRTVGA